MLATACAGNRPAPNQIFLMPAPGVYAEGRIDPFIDSDPISRGVQPSILFATDRQPAEPGDKSYDYFTHRRGGVLRLGVAEIDFGMDAGMAWEEVRRISLLQNRTSDYPLAVSGVRVFGVLDGTINALNDAIEISPEPGRASSSRSAASPTVRRRFRRDNWHGFGGDACHDGQNCCEEEWTGQFNEIRRLHRFVLS